MSEQFADKPVEDQRDFERRALTLNVRYITHSDLEATGRLQNISEGGLYMSTEADAEIGDEIVAYPEGLGRLCGVIVRKDENGVAIEFDITQQQRTYLTKRIASALTGAPYLRIFENRGQNRMNLNLEAKARVLPDGELFDCTIIDLSQSGAAICADYRPPLGASVSLGAINGEVCRHTPEGFALSFGSSTAAEHS